MRSLHILSCATAVSAFNLFGDLFQRQQPNCTVYTVVEYPCAVQTFLPSNTVVWVDACSTTLNITNAPTSLKTTITSTTTIGLPKTSTSTVVVSLKTTATIFHTLTLPGPAQPTTTSSTAPVITGTNSGCVPSSTSYPSAPNIPANTTYVISVTSPEIIAHLGNSPVYLTREGGVVDNTNLAVEVFFYDGVLFALDTAFGVGWYGMELSEATMPFALEQYSSSSQSIARTFTTVGSSPPTLAWNNCQFQNENVTWTLNESDGVVSAWFSDSDSNSFGLKPKCTNGYGCSCLVLHSAFDDWICSWQ
ncbi:uncharacterized protein LY89DRAFT_205961 [Mollisia scopiformis]|uniref:Uncharacterized protein n=1 Tax=Mollisia scopiformis TaxID=149040 RepID=A0A194WWK8_MOLSC|nr:uncharacterized protein LY89DRAFT_205961 [Mollisia scopiformis]KUJ12335.1 hypothetical protein LY89DRAFT_205961 [Mollisia scopiformis]